MNKATLTAVFIIFSLTCFSQETKPVNPPLTKQEYMKKSKTNKIAAWILLGVGATCFAIVAPGNTDFDNLGTIVVIGGISVLTSIPLFIAAAKNKKRALNASAFFKIQKIPALPNMAYANMPALSVRLNF